VAAIPRERRLRRAGGLVGGLVLGIGAGLACERAAMRAVAGGSDPETGEPFGRLPGRATAVPAFDGTRLHVEELGSGPCLVFAHGFSLRGDAWHYQRRDLPGQGFRCVFLDHRGHGRSGEAASGDYSLDALARDLAAVLEWTGERKVVLVAHSMSGLAALRLAELDPDLLERRLAGLVLVSTSYADNLRGMATALAGRTVGKAQFAVYSAAYRLMGDDPHLAHQLRRRGSDLGYLTTRWGGFGPSPSPAQVAFVDQVLAGTDARVWAEVYPGLLDIDLEHVLAGLRLPVLLAAGDADRLFPLEGARHMAASIPGARLLILPDAGHMAFMERHELLDHAVTSFARECFAGTT
jgi:pimeloyl-ACP methyl ester carboxylesterase